MFKILNSKIYKKSFYMYTAALAIIFSLIFIVLENRMLSDAVSYYKNSSKQLFENSEEKINDITQKIDNYVVKLYLDPMLLEDFMFFWGKSPEDYLTERLENTYYNKVQKSFVNDIRNFLLDMNCHIKRVYFKSDTGINVLDINNKGKTSYSFFIDEKEFKNECYDLTNGYIYEKAIKMPGNVANILGSMIFVLDNEYVFNTTRYSNFDGVQLNTIYGSQYIYTNINEEFIKTEREKAPNVSLNGFSLNRKINDFIYYSDKNHYELSFVLHRYHLFKDKMMISIVLLLSVLIAFFAMMSVVIIHMYKESRFLSHIIDSIQYAHKGKFKKIKIGKRKDEYATIAREFNIMTSELEEYIEKQYLLKIKQQETEMKALLYQINPHFLYNTLEIIRSCALKNSDEQSAEALSFLGKMYRMLVKEDNVISLEKELELLSCYLKIMEFKYENCFYYQLDVEPSVLKLKTIKFWLQPLVENFFIHGFDSSSEFNLVIIKIFETELTYEIEVIDNGLGIGDNEMQLLNEGLNLEDDESQSQGIGLRNVYRRLRYFYSNGCEMKLIKNDGEGLIVKVSINK